MARSVEFFFDVGSPAAYLAWTQLPELCAENAAELIYKPMLLGGVFQATGNASPAMIPLKGRYLIADYARFARRYAVPLTMNPHFPINTLPLMRAVTAVQARQPDRFEAFLACVFRAFWVEAVDLGNPERVAATLAAAGFEAETILEWVEDAEIKTLLKANTAAAVGRGVFGAPTIFVGQQMFFGQDRLDFVREALGAL